MSASDSNRPRPPAQGNLFGEPPAPERPRSARRGVGAADVPEDVRALRAAVPPEVRFGTSSWSFPGWTGLVYDREVSKATLARRGLGPYAEHPLLRAVGVDRTYYAPMTAEALADYATAVPDDFRFLVKACAACTAPTLSGSFAGSPGPDEPNPTFLDPAFARDEIVGPFVEGLGPKGGVLLFQFPPLGRAIVDRPEVFAERLARFFADLPYGPPYAVELRDRELLTRDYADAVRSAGVEHCVNVHPRMPAPAVQRACVPHAGTGPSTIRWMLHAGLRYEGAVERYTPFGEIVDRDPEARGTLADLVVEDARRGVESIVIVNNKAEGSAPRSIAGLAREIAERTPAGG